MKFAVISDTHIGDPECSLVVMDNNNKPSDGRNMPKLLETLGKDNDYLIILGDTMDFAVNNYEDVYLLGAYFFKRIKEARVAKRIVYIPGNHDYNIWDTIEYQANVINQISSGQPARRFRMSVPLIIDDRTAQNSNNTIKLVGVHKQDSGEPYGGMFLDDLIPDNKPDSPDYIPFIVAFPNIYLFTDNGSVFLTHGQYLETYWSETAQIYRVIKKIKTPFTMKDYVAINFPLCQLGSTGLGQAGPLTDTVLEVEKDVLSGKCVLIKQYIIAILNYLVPSKLPNFLQKRIFSAIADAICGKLKRVRNSDYISDLTVKKDADTIRKFNEYIDSSVEEVKQLLQSGEISNVNAIPDTFLFGHTHVPVVDADKKTYKYQGKQLKLLNTGGWLNIRGKISIPTGGEVFFYETGKGFSSTRISVIIE